LFLRPGSRVSLGSGLLLWWPFSIVGFDSCPGEGFLVDLVVASEAGDPLPLILTMRRYRGRHSLDPSPPVEAPIVVPRGVGPNSILEMLLKAWRRVREGGQRAGGPVDIKSLRRAAEQLRLRRPHTLEEAVANPITRGILSEILSSICIEGEHVRITGYSPIYILVGVDRKKGEFHLYMERRIRSPNHEIYALGSPEVQAILDKYQLLGKS